MNYESYARRTLAKLQSANELYAKWMLKRVAHVNQVDALQTREHLRQPPETGWQPMDSGAAWGGEWNNLWIRATVKIPEAAAGKRVYLRPDTGAVETLCFLRGMPCGIINSKNHFLGGEHSAVFLTEGARAGEEFPVAFECYAGHHCPGTQPYENYGCDEPAEGAFAHAFRGLDVLVLDEAVHQMCFDLMEVLQAAELDEDNFLRRQARAALDKVFVDLIQDPANRSAEEIHASALRCIADMADVLAPRAGSDETRGFVGITGHSHMDTAWLWPMDETIRKCARTYSQALSLMNRYPEYRFLQSSALHLDWMRQNYPAIFAGIRRRVAEGRYEPNGGVWVECDCNIPSGESIVRQFLYGQRFTREHFGYTSDCFWLPDTFGYNAALPQILRQCGVKYFYTTKIGWNDLNKFPADSFLWKGMDGSSVITHFNLIHTFPDVKNVGRAIREIPDKQASDQKLLAFGFGDGGGGPTEGMVELARRTAKMRGVPTVQYVSASEFMHRLEGQAQKGMLPEYRGELYLELHRGTLTQMHEIKRNNRKAEIALHDMEFANVYARAPRHKETDALYKVLLQNQFHDILPGTSIQSVNDRACREVRLSSNAAKRLLKQFLLDSVAATRPVEGAEAEGLKNGARAFVGRRAGADDSLKGSGHVTLVNTLSHERRDAVLLPDEGMAVAGAACQRYSDPLGRAWIACAGLALPPLSAQSFALEPLGQERGSAFTAAEGARCLETPIYAVRFDENGYIASLFDKRVGREVRRAGGAPLGTLYLGEDVPADWDNWDIDSDMEAKMRPVTRLLSRETVSDGAVEMRIRAKYALGERSAVTMDTVFYAEDPRVDFHLLVDWQEKHALLKVGFDVDISASMAKHEIQFGHIERPVTRNNSWEAAKFEVCNHEWTDLSESRYGVALLNDCKYGISVRDSDMRLTLHKGGCRPDPTGDVGQHEMLYALLPHLGPMGAENVIAPARELNYPALYTPGMALSCESLATVSASNVLIETVKCAEDVENAFVLRLYEAERCRTNCTLRFAEEVKRVCRVNMLEEIEEELAVDDGCVALSFRPFEIQSILVERAQEKFEQKQNGR